MLSQKHAELHVRSVVFLAILFAVLPLSAFGQAGTSLVINHFILDPVVIEGHLVVSDVDGTGGSVDIAFFDEKGELAGRGSETIPRFGKVNVNPEKYLGSKKMIGTVRINSTKPVTGQYWQFYKDPSLGWKNIAVPAAAGPGSTKLVCQHFVSDPDLESYLVVANGESRSTVVYVEFYSDNGDLAGQEKLTIPGNGKFSIQPYNLVGRRKMTGLAYLQTEGGKITGEYWQVAPNERYQVAHAMQGSAPKAEVLAADPLMRVMVNFDFDSDKIQKRSYADLDEVAKAMNSSRNTKAKYEVGGHTDNVGKHKYNMTLSERRAGSVKSYLTKQGVSSSRLVTVGYGPDKPIVDNDTKANRARNRRVEFKIIK